MSFPKHGLAFGFIPVYLYEDHIEAKNWFYDILFSLVSPVWQFFMFLQTLLIDPEFEPEGFPVKVKDEIL